MHCPKCGSIINSNAEECKFCKQKITEEDKLKENIIGPNELDGKMEFRGLNGFLVLDDTGIIIKRGARGFVFGGLMLRGDKTIPYSSIIAVQLKKATFFTNGYLQLSLRGGSEAKGGLYEAAGDENTILFTELMENANENFERAKKIIEERMVNPVANKTNYLDDLERLAKLKEKGIITEEEFQAKKKQILG